MAKEKDIMEYLKVRTPNDILVDLCEKTLHDFGRIEGAINIPTDEIKKFYNLPKDKDIYLFCRSGESSREIAELLTDAGYNACNLSGGYRKYLLGPNWE